MMVLLDVGGIETLTTRGDELGLPYGRLLTPSRVREDHTDLPFGIDNGAFSGFHEDAFWRLLELNDPHRDRCLFLAVPDVVGSAQRTREVWDRWHERLAGWPLAYVAQDGQDHVEIPWDGIDYVFIGGTDQFKLGTEAVAVIKAAKILGKKVHVGRINTPSRFARFEELGCDSCDGSGMSRYDWMREWIAMRAQQTTLDFATSHPITVAKEKT